MYCNFFNSEAICTLFSSVQVEELLQNQIDPKHFGKLKNAQLSKKYTKRGLISETTAHHIAKADSQDPQKNKI